MSCFCFRCFVVPQCNIVLYNMSFNNGSRSYKSPPEITDNEYETWRREIELWQIVTDLEKSKQAVAIALSLRGKYRDVATGISSATLSAEDGVTSLLDELDKHFKKNDVDSAYEAYRDFDKFERVSNQSITDFIQEFEKRYGKLTKHNMTLPSTVQGCKLLEAADLETTQKQMILSACSSLDYNIVCGILRRTFGSFVSSSESSLIKSEVFYSKGGHRASTNGQLRRKNPKDKSGRVSKCAVCESVFHWARDCPHKDPNYESRKLQKDETALIGEATSSTHAVESMVTFALATGSALWKVCWEGHFRHGVYKYYLWKKVV